MKKFKYILTHSSGNLTPEYAPIDWKAFNMMWSRSEAYYSVLRSQIIDVEFPRDGKSYIDSIYNTYGIDAEIGCEVQYLRSSDLSYQTLFEGVLDLSEWLSRRDTTSVKIGDSSVLAKFVARHETEIPLNRTTDLDGNTLGSYTYLNTMKVEGVDIEELAKYEDDTNEIPMTTGTSASSFELFRGISDDGFQVNDIGTDATLPVKTLSVAGGLFYTNNSGASQTVRYRIVTRIVGEVVVINDAGFNWAARVYLGVDTPTIVKAVNRIGSGGDIYSFDESYDSGYITRVLTAGQTIGAYHKWSGNLVSTGTITPAFTFEPTLLEVYEVTPAKADTSHDIPLLHEIGAKLLEIMTGEADALDSDLLGRTDSEPRTYSSDGDYSLTGLASGNILRGNTYGEKPFSTTFYDYFKSLDALYNLGMWYNGTDFEIKEKVDYFKNSQIIDLGEVKDLEISIAADKYFNKINCGYQNELEYEELNGTQNFNVPAKFVNSIAAIDNTLDIASIYHADDYGIELARKNADENSTEDSKFDEQIFIITGQRDGGNYITLQGYDDFTVIESIYSPDTRLNLNITPKRNLLRWQNVLNVPEFISNNDTQYSTKQFGLALETKKTAEAANVVETDDITYATQPIYYPEIYNFTAKVEFAHILQLGSDPHGYVEFTYLGTTYKGFILEVSTELFNRRGNWTLIKLNASR